jgi:hypothetical protein
VAVRADLIDQARQVRRALIRVARDDFDVFVELINRDESTGEPLQQAWFHKAWTKLRAEHDRLVLLSFPEAGKTQQTAALVLWHLGRNPRERIAVISRTQGQAIDVVTLIRTKIEQPGVLHEIFPELRRSTTSGARWTQTQLDVERPAGIKEPSVQAFGLAAGAITGKRVDRFILDDVLDLRTTRTKAARAAVSTSFWREIYNRRSKHATFVVIGNPWHPDDWYHELERAGWATYRFPVRVTPALKQQWGALAPELGKSSWPGRWTEEYIDKLEREMPPKEFRRSYLVHVDIDVGSPFKVDDIDKALERGRALGSHDNVDALELAWNMHRLACLGASPEVRERITEIQGVALAVEALTGESIGRGLTGQARAEAEWSNAAQWTSERLVELGSDWEDLVMITGVDPSSGTARDPSAIVTMAWSRSTNERIVCAVEFGWWEQPELMDRVIDEWERWDSLIVFEDVGIQRWGQQTLQAMHPEMPIYRLPTTGMRKSSQKSGLPAFAHRFHRGQLWLCNNGVLTMPMQQFVRGMTSFDPESHPDDVLMAAWFCDHWIYERGERRTSSVSAKMYG